MYLDILQTLAGVIADIIVNSDKSEGTSTLNLSFVKKAVNGETNQILTIQIYGEEASTIYPIDVTSQEFQIELLDLIQSNDNRESLVRDIYTILLQRLNQTLEPSILDSSHTEVFGNDPNRNVSH